MPVDKLMKMVHYENFRADYQRTEFEINREGA